MWNYGPGSMMGYGGWGPGGGIMPFGGLFGLVVIVLGFALVIWVIRMSWHPGHHRPYFERRSPGLEMLEQRYARGEITRDEYLEKKADIVG